VLEFGESVEVISAGVTRSDRGVGAFAIFDPTDVSDGASAHLMTALDGRIQTDFGTLPIEADGTVRFGPRDVDQPLWSWGDPALTHLMVEVRNAAGAVVSTWSTRTGVRSTQMTPKGLRINENLGVVAAIRVPHGLNEPDMLTVFSGAVGGGANAVEIHGAIADSELMDIADEMGIPIIHLPRCVGRVGRPPGNGASLLETLRSQDERLVRAVGAHPSVVSWLIEGDRQILGPGRKESGELDTFTSVIPSDPMERPVVGVDIPGTLLRIPDLRKADINCPAGCEGKWIVESTFRIVPTPSLWHSVAAAWSRALAKGIPGGTLPSAKVSELAVWSEAFAPVLAEAGVKPFPLERERRADSRIRISGAAAGSVVWVTAPGMTPKGAQVASDGTAAVDVWYSGSATVHGVGWSQDVSLSAMSWKGPKLYGYSTEVIAPQE